MHDTVGLSPWHHRHALDVFSARKPEGVGGSGLGSFWEASFVVSVGGHAPNSNMFEDKCNVLSFFKLKYDLV